MYFKRLILLVCVVGLSGCGQHHPHKDTVCKDNEQVLKPHFLYAVTREPMVNRTVVVKRITGKTETYKTDKEGYIPTLCSNSKNETVQFIVQKPN